MKTNNSPKRLAGSGPIPKPLSWLLPLLIASILWYSQNHQKAKQTATPMEVIMKVRQAAMLLSQQGASALATLRDSNSAFSWKDTYVFVVNCQADLVMANPAFPEREGDDILEHTDYQGKPYGLALCEAASPKGAWIQYSWPKPGEKTAQRKISYLISVPGQPYQVGAGIYDSTYSLQELNEMIKASP
ncbi:MAG: cache domain-containing protein [Saprospiraceae bacterium]|nr:cache domain-containing protein [Saprospiraceae bacterium]